MDDVSAGRRPSPPWLGLVASLLLLTGFLGQIAYTLFEPPGLSALGAWNYAAGWALIVSSVLLLRYWRGEPYDNGDAETRSRPTPQEH